MRVTEPYIIFPRKLPSGRIVYYYQYRDENGRRSNPLSTGETVLSKAKRKISRMYNEGLFTKSESSLTFCTFTKDFFSKESEFYKYQMYTGKTIKDSTLDSYSKILANQLIPFFGEMKLSSINRDTIKNWIIWAGQFWSQKTLYNAYGVLSIIFTSATDKDLIVKSPLTGYKFHKSEKKERTLLTVDELRLIYKSELWARDSERRMFLLAAITGMRIGEISGLMKKNVHENWIDVRYTFSDKFGLGTPKTGLCRKVPILADFNFGSSESEWVFEGITSDKPLMSHAVYNCFSRICDKLGIKRKERGITIHSLRNFFISYLQSENVSESKIKAVVGHSDKCNMTEHYTYWTPEMFPEVYAAQRKLYEQITGGENV